MEKDNHKLAIQKSMDSDPEVLNEKIFALEKEVERLNALLAKSDDTLRTTIDENSKNQKLIEAIFNSVPGMIYLYDDMGKLVKWNKRFELMTGFSEKEMLNKDMLDWFKDSPENQKNINLGLNKMALTGYGEAEATLICKNGRAIPMFFTATPLYWDNKEHVAGVGIDISTQKKAFELLTESEKKYRNLFNNTTTAFALHELIFDSEKNVVDYRFLEVNPAFERITGLKATEIEGKTCREVLPDTENFWIEMYAKVGTTGETAQFENYSSSLNRYFQGTAYSNEYGRFATFFVDITDRRKMENYIIENEIRYRAIFNNSYESILIVDQKSGEILDLNDTTLKMFEYSEKSDLLYSSIDHLSARKADYSPEKYQLLLQKVLESNQVQTQWLSLRKDGTTFESEISLKKISIEGKDEVIYTVRDISIQRKAEESNRNNAQLLNDILQNSNSLIYIVDTKQRFITVNSKFASLIGKTPYELIGKTRFDFLPVHVAYEHNENDALVLQNAKPMNFDEQYPESDATHFYFTVKFPLFDKNQNIYGIAAISTDVTPTRLAVDALAASERKFQRLFDEHAAMKLLIDSETGMIADANKSAEEYYGWSKEELCQMSISQINVLSIDEIKEQMQAVTESRRKSFIFKHRHKDGSISDVEVFSSKVNIDGKKYHHSIIMDITQQKRAEIALVESQKLYHSFVEHIPGAVFRKDVEGRYVFVNEIFCKTKRLKPEEIIGKNVLELYEYEKNNKRIVSKTTDFLQETLPEGDAHHQRIIQTGETIEVEEVYIMPDGTRKYYQVVKSPVFGFNNKVVGSQCIQFDITERKLAETALLKKERQLQTMISNLPGFVYRCAYDKNWTMLYISNGCLPITGYNPEDLLNNNKIAFNDLIHPDDQPGINKTWENVVPENKVFTKEYRIIDIHGNIRWVWEQGRPVRDIDKNELYLEGFITEITDRKNAEEALALSEEKFRTLFSEMSDSVAIYNLIYNEKNEIVNFRFTDCNRSFSNIFNKDPDEIIGKTYTEVFGTNTIEYFKEICEVALEGKTFQYERYVDSIDKSFHVSLVSPMHGTYASVATDISEISKFNKMLQEKNKELESYVYITSHDLRSPLVNIQGFSSRLKKQTEKIQHILKDSMSDDEREKLLNEQLNEKIPLSLDYIFTNVVKMDRMLNGLLQISRTGRLPMQIQKIDMDMLIRNIIKSLNHEISKKNANIEVEKLPDCFGDDNLLNQLFSNIIGNALKYSKEDIQPLIHISGKHLKNKSLYCITDNGIGIPETQIAKIWNVFFRVDYKSYSGEGIGLSVVKRIVEKHKGQIWVESKEGEGTNFFIELPNHVFSE